MGNSIGAISGLLGLGGGMLGTGVGGPQQANIQPLTNQQQLDTSYGQNQTALGQQQNLLQALQNQGGLNNQTQVYNQLQGVANGTGPNPAQAMLNQATGQNVAAQGALAAGQRGAASNVGLIARQAGQQGANLQQQAVGQGATMQANQSLNALGQLGGIANNQVANQIGQTNAYQQAAQGNQQQLLNALASQNQSNVSSQGSVNAANAGLAGQQLQGQQGLIGGVLNAAGTAAGGLGGAPKPAAHGGIMQPMADGGTVAPQSSFGQFLMGGNTGANALNKGMTNFGSGIGNMLRSQPAAQQQQLAQPGAPGGEAPGNFGGGGMVDVALSPGEKVVPPNKVGEAAGGRVEAKTVPGKAKVPGDSLKNDTYKTKVPEGSVVIPRTKVGDKKSEASFVQATLAKRGKK